jgi:deazaflavin-dependent oxidoreductase (nitroreductase family)
MTKVPPETLKTIRKEKFAYLTTVGRRTGRPHSVEVWFSMVGERVFLSHEGDYTDWMRNLTKNKRIRIQIGRANLEADATIVKEGESKELGKRSLYEKYYGPAPKATIDDWFELSTIVELSSLNLP